MIAILYALAVGGLVVYGLNLLWLAIGFLRHDREEDTPPNRTRFREDTPTVTVQLPIYNERYVAERLIDACAALEYPAGRLEIQVLDDSTDATTHVVAGRVSHWRAAGIDIRHVRRSTREGFKAGALQHGLARARGELIAIFDADFLPSADFLERLLPYFTDPAIGMVQVRWSYLNRESSLLTRLQAFGLDAHFAVEQFVRNRVGCFINFNGTAGVWRKACIDDAGGWHSDTLTEDLDISYRAQLAGWRFKFLRRHEAPSELPIGMNDVRAQQSRWTKGAIQTAMKTLSNLVKNAPDRRTRLEGVIHLTSHLVFPLVLIAGLLHAPLAYARSIGAGPPEWYYGWMTLGTLAFVGFFAVQLLAQRSLHADWLRRIALFPLYAAGSMGLAINNTVAIAEAISGQRSVFERTPKHGSSDSTPSSRWWHNDYSVRRLPRIVLVELAMAVYCLCGLLLVVVLGAWSALPFQALITLGFGLVAISNLVQVAEVSR